MLSLDHARAEFMPRIVTLAVAEWFRRALGAGIPETSIDRLPGARPPCLRQS